MVERTWQERADLLSAALLWLRNHYDTDGKDGPEVRKRVLATIDLLINENYPSVLARAELRRLMYFVE